MSTERKNLEVFVGIFLVIGLGFIATLVVTFGRVGQGLQKKYPLLVEFPNAGGLVKDSDVLLSGARIGSVAESPQLAENSYRVIVKINIREDVKIPRKARFLIGSSGLLGDRFVDVIPPPGEFDPKDMAEPGESILGSRATGLDDLTAKGSVVLDQVSEELGQIKKLTADLHQGLLSERNIKNLEETIQSLRTTSENLSASSLKIDPVLTDAQAVVGSAKSAMKTVDLAATDVRKAIADVQTTTASVNKTMDSATQLLKKAGDGQGPLGALLSDKQSAENLKAFLWNLRRSGPLFYKDRPLPGDAAPQKPR